MLNPKNYLKDFKELYLFTYQQEDTRYSKFLDIFKSYQPSKQVQMIEKLGMK